MPFDLAIGPDDIDGILSALRTAFEVALIFTFVAALVIAFGHFEDWREERNSPVGRITRKRHFGGF